MLNEPRARMIPIFTTKGDVGAVLVYPYLYNILGEWIGWLTADRKVYSVHGRFVGYLTKDPRILRKREVVYDEPDQNPPFKPTNILLPSSFPLAPMMSELAMGMMDVLDEAPDLLAPIDFGLKDLD